MASHAITSEAAAPVDPHHARDLKKGIVNVYNENFGTDLSPWLTPLRSHRRTPVLSSVSSSTSTYRSTQATASVTLGYKPEQVYALGELLLTVRQLREQLQQACSTRSTKWLPTS